MNYFYPKSVRLRKRRQFQKVALHGTRHLGDFIIIEARQTPGVLTRLGITVTRRFGKAHCRNRFKRVIREAFRLCRERLQSGLDVNVRPKKNASSVKTHQIIDEFIRLIGKEHHEFPRTEFGPKASC